MTRLLMKLFFRGKGAVARKTYGFFAGMVGIGCNLLLFCLKLTAGLLSGSMSVLADAFNNLTDMGSSVVTMLGLKISEKPADRDHPFGHGRMEYMSAFIVSTIIVVVGLELLRSSIEKILSPQALTASVWTFVILGASILLKFWMFLFQRSLGKAIDSAALHATSLDSVNDCIATAAVLVSVLLSVWFDWNVDAYAGLAVSLFIIWSGIRSAKETLDPLLGTPPDPALIRRIIELVLQYDAFVGIHDLIVHNYGLGRCFASLHVEVPDTANMVECHETIDHCEKQALEQLGLELVIHMDPIATDDAAVTAAKEAIQAQLCKLDERLTLHDFRMVLGEKRTNLIFDVVVPADISLTAEQLKENVDTLAKELDPTYCCVVTIDRDYTGRFI